MRVPDAHQPAQDQIARTDWNRARRGRRWGIRARDALQHAMYEVPDLAEQRFALLAELRLTAIVELEEH